MAQLSFSAYFDDFYGSLECKKWLIVVLGIFSFRVLNFLMTFLKFT